MTIILEPNPAKYSKNGIGDPYAQIDLSTGMPSYENSKSGMMDIEGCDLRGRDEQLAVLHGSWWT